MRARPWLLGLGASITLAGSLTIETALLLLLTPVHVDRLATVVLCGIGAVAVGVVLLWWGHRLR